MIPNQDNNLHNPIAENSVKTSYTKHAEKRTRERVGLPKKSVMKNTEKALQYGICYDDCTGRLKKYYDWLYFTHRNNNVRIYSNHVYIFSCKGKLITVLPLPKEHRDSVNKTMKRKETHHAKNYRIHKSE